MSEVPSTLVSKQRLLRTRFCLQIAVFHRTRSPYLPYTQRIPCDFECSGHRAVHSLVEHSIVEIIGSQRGVADVTKLGAYDFVLDEVSRELTVIDVASYLRCME